MGNNKKSFGQIWSELTSEQTKYLKNYINKQRQDAVEHYKSEQLILSSVSNRKKLLIDFLDDVLMCQDEGVSIVDREKYVNEYLGN